MRMLSDALGLPPVFAAMLSRSFDQAAPEEELKSMNQFCQKRKERRIAASPPFTGRRRSATL